MTDIPIIFSGPMVRALPAGRKTMTRRLLYTERKAKSGIIPASATMLEGHDPPRIGDRWPNTTPAHYWTLSSWSRVKPGDRLWVRETWGRFCDLDDNDQPASEVMTYYRADGEPFDRWVDPDTGETRDSVKWRSPIHCPRAYSRITIVVTATKIEWLQQITETECIAEGAEIVRLVGNPVDDGPMVRLKDHVYGTPQTWFRELWCRLNGAESWDANPEVVALTFAVHQTNIDAMKVAA